MRWRPNKGPDGPAEDRRAAGGRVGAWLPATLRGRVRGWLDRFRRRDETPPAPPRRGSVDHVVILDGTMSTLTPGGETNVGLTYNLLREVRGRRLSIFYEAGIQWENWKSSRDVWEGRGIDAQIARAYGFLASRWRPGDRIFLFGYSRGAYAVRSLAGVIDSVGLLRAEEATERMIRQAYRHYEIFPEGAAAGAFRRRYCHPEVPIEMIGVWDTVKALGVRLPFVWKISDMRYAFHSHALGRSVRHGYQALALDETREAYAPVLWETWPERDGRVEQMWFRGAHPDIGGQLAGFEAARPLSNIPLVWMLEKAESHGLPLPENWQSRFPQDPQAPMVGTWRGWGRVFLARRRRVAGRDRSERLHPSVRAPSRAVLTGALAKVLPCP